LVTLFGGDYALVGFVGMLVQPAGQRAAQVKADVLKMPCCGVGGVTLGGDALVPVGIGSGGRFPRDAACEGIGPGGLIEVAVDAEVAI